MKVRAKTKSPNGQEKRMMGYYNHKRIREGDVFELVAKKRVDGTIITAEQQFSSRWMEKINEPIKNSFSPVVQQEPIIADEPKEIGSDADVI